MSLSIVIPKPNAAEESSPPPLPVPSKCLVHADVQRTSSTHDACHKPDLISVPRRGVADSSAVFGVGMTQWVESDALQTQSHYNFANKDNLKASKLMSSGKSPLRSALMKARNTVYLSVVLLIATMGLTVACNQAPNDSQISNQLQDKLKKIGRASCRERV